MQTMTAHKPKKTPFLNALCWHSQHNAAWLNNTDALTLYESGWRHLGVLVPSLTLDEAKYIQQLAIQYNSFLAHDIKHYLRQQTTP